MTTFWMEAISPSWFPFSCVHAPCGACQPDFIFFNFFHPLFPFSFKNILFPKKKQFVEPLNIDKRNDDLVFGNKLWNDQRTFSHLNAPADLHIYFPLTKGDTNAQGSSWESWSFSSSNLTKQILRKKIDLGVLLNQEKHALWFIFECCAVLDCTN